MRVMSILLIPNLCVVLLGIKTLLALKNTPCDTVRTVRMPLYLLVIGELFVPAALMTNIYGVINYTEWKLAVCVAALILSSTFLLLYCSISVEYFEDSFTVKRIFRKHCVFHYEEITGIIWGEGFTYTLLLGKKKVYFDNLAVGGFEFYLFANEKVLKRKGASIPAKENRLFNGYVKEPVPIVVIVSLVNILSVLVIIWLSVEVYKNGAENVFVNAHFIGEINLEILCFWLIVAVEWVGSFVGYYILSNAPKYPVLAGLLIKKNHRNW